ncbi:MAG: hemolysin III family protein [Clostridia bacterium]|nr:hemolysin III family protein [Clostridia bacterium]
MFRTKLKDRILPFYTRGEEIFNMTSHIVGGALGVVALSLCVIFAAIYNDAYAVVSSAIYGFTIILLYTMSSIYHGLKPERPSKKVFQILDHCSIFLLIAGSYTPFCLVTLRQHSTVEGWLIFGIIWGMAILGIALNSIDIKKFKLVSMICYLVMGWCIIVRIHVLPQYLGLGGILFLALGGVSYTVGAVLYALGKRNKKLYVHSIFHLFVLLGTILQFFCIFFYVIL